MSPLTAWQNFYVIVGSAAGALIGLQFVVMTLVASRPPSDAEAAIAAFASPQIVHFEMALLLSAVLCAPWGEIATVSVVWGLVGLGGIVYSVVVVKRMRVQTVYQPMLEDWWYHVLFPLAAYAILVVSALLAQLHTQIALFAIAAATLILLFIGIHNAWDAIAWHVTDNRSDKEATK